jgi:hypothetical protein
VFDSLATSVLLHSSNIWGATTQIGLTSFGRQESDATEQVQSSSFFRGLLGVRASTQESLFWASLAGFHFL